MEHHLENQVAIVTGGNAGIGRAIVHRFVAEGAKVAIFATNAERGQETVDQVNTEFGEDCARFWQVDVSDTDAVDMAVKDVLQTLGSIDILVNNAGITRDNLLMRIGEKDWDAVINVNLKSCYNTCRAVYRPMLKARKGKIINISSVVGLTGNAGQVNYAASKSGIVGLTMSLARELASRGICVNCIAPGFIATKMTEELNEKQQEQVLSAIPLNRMGKPEEVASAAVFLASSDADYITGQTLTVDGGMVMS